MVVYKYATVPHLYHFLFGERLFNAISCVWLVVLGLVSVKELGNFSIPLKKSGALIPSHLPQEPRDRGLRSEGGAEQLHPVHQEEDQPNEETKEGQTFESISLKNDDNRFKSQEIWGPFRLFDPSLRTFDARLGPSGGKKGYTGTTGLFNLP